MRLQRKNEMETIKTAFEKGLKGFTLKSHGTKFICVRIEFNEAICINCETAKPTKIWAEKLTAQCFKINPNDSNVKFLERFHKINLSENLKSKEVVR